MTPELTDNTTADLTLRECRAARRLTRLFKIQHAGGFARRPVDTWRRLMERRGAVIDEVLGLEKMRRMQSSEIPAALGEALADLAREVGRSQALAEARVALLADELSHRSGDSPASGVRAGMAGQLLGRG